MLAVKLAGIEMRHLLAVQKPENVSLLANLVLPIVRIAVRPIPSLDHPDGRVQLANPSGSHLQRNRRYLRLVDDHDQLVDLAQSRLEHILMPFMQRGKLAQS